MKHTKRRAFFLALGISLFLFITAVGFVVVDYQGRRLSFGESQPPLWLRRLPGGRYTLEVDLLGVEASCWISSACPTADHGRQKASLAGAVGLGRGAAPVAGGADLRPACALLDGGCGGVVLGGAGLFDRGPGSAVELPPQGEAALFLALPAPGNVPGGGEKQAPAVKIIPGIPPKNPQDMGLSR